MLKKLNVYDSEGTIIKTSDEVTGNSVKVTIDNLKPSTSYNAGDFKVSWVIDGKESEKTNVPGFKTIEPSKPKEDNTGSNTEQPTTDTVAQPIIVNTLAMDNNSFTISDQAPTDTNKIWFKPAN